MAENIVSQESFAARIVDSTIWSQLPDEVIESMLKWLPLESLTMFRAVCKNWNNLLSAERFLTWRRENFKEDPWLLFITCKYRPICYRFNLSTRALKAFPLNPVVLASVGGLVVSTDSQEIELYLYNPLTDTGTQIPRTWQFSIRRSVIVCNPVTEAFVQLVPVLDKEHGIILGDILWQGSQYQLVAAQMYFIEVYDFQTESWVTVQRLPRGFQTVGGTVFFKGFYFLTMKNFGYNSEWGIMVFSIKEDCTCPDVRLFLPVPKTDPWWGYAHLLVCGSALFLIRERSPSLYLWELQYNSNLNITSNLSWEAIANMPEEMFTFLFSDLEHPWRVYQSLAVGNYICFAGYNWGNLVFFNKQDRSWNCFSLSANVEIPTRDVGVFIYDPRPDLLIQ